MPFVRFRNWFGVGLLNLTLVAFLGLVMRWKIAFDFPFFEQRNLLHAHSHFAFSGWITHLLYAAFGAVAMGVFSPGKQARYQWMTGLNLACAFGMLVAFSAQGYKPVSIFFSTSSLLIGVCFAWYYISDLRAVRAPFAPWAITALLLNVFSSIGPLQLAWMMATRSMSQDLYLGSVYFYLHFQYNGWFFFGSIALIVYYFRLGPVLNRYFPVFLLTVFPTFLLSVLWMKIPQWLNLVAAGAAVLQLFTWLLVLRRVSGSRRRNDAPVSSQGVLFLLAAIAITLKFMLQALSAIPSLNQLVFGFRPIVIAYLHLVLLGGYSLFFLGFMIAAGVLRPSGMVRLGTAVFVAGVLLNEALLAIQGAAAFSYFPVPFTNELLVAAAVLLLTGALGCWTGFLITPAGKKRN